VRRLYTAGAAQRGSQSARASVWRLPIRLTLCEVSRRDTKRQRNTVLLTFLMIIFLLQDEFSNFNHKKKTALNPDLNQNIAGMMITYHEKI
jgi:hypothetical protein